ncbi:MAG: radical SAM/SPASM domain-containing protein, partial [Candidatus Hodarchaeota archaeon]
MIQLIPKIPAYQMFRYLGFPRLFPLNLTVSLTYRCNSRCKTCNIYEKKVSEFTLVEFDKTFQSIGTIPFWLTMSGGEPFLRKDIVEICQSAYVNCRPKIINIPTNGILSDIIPGKVSQIAKNSADAQIIINLSIDEIGERHDEIRNVKKNFAKAKETFNRLKELSFPNLTVGIHSVISKYNVNNFKNVYKELNRLNPDSYITEIAEERVELGTLGHEIAPSIKDYCEAVDFLSKKIKERQYNGISNITQAFRIKYYELVKKTLKEKRQILPCYAGFISAQISPDGNVWACCVKAESMGNLRDVNYNFDKVWFSNQAQRIRRPIRDKKCFCPLANASYTN